MSELFGETRTRVAWNHAVIAPDSHVTSPIVGWDWAEGVVLISPAMAAGGPRFVQYLVNGSAFTTGAADGVQRLVYVLSGTVRLDSVERPADSAFWFPPGEQYELEAFGDTKLLVFEKAYEAFPGAEMPDRVVTSLQVAPVEPFMGDPDAMLSTLLPTDARFDMAVNVFTFRPGAALPLVETHVMEHGLYMKQGQGVYRLGESWYPVQAGDTIWMASYCPQWFTAMGKKPAAYVYYKDVNRDPLAPTAGQP